MPGGVLQVGVAEDYFPDPKGWRLGSMDVDLDKGKVRSLTRAMTGLSHVPPSCLAAWAKRIGELPLDVGGRYNNSLLTPRDWTSHFKNVMHRAMLTRSVTTQEPCRCCSYASEKGNDPAIESVCGRVVGRGTGSCTSIGI